MKKVILIFLALIVLSIGVFATTDLKIEELFIPSTYNELVEAYKSIANIAINYQRLYNEAEDALAESEVDNQSLLEIIKNLQLLIDTQQDIINKLLNKNRFSISTGISYTPLNPSYSSVILGVMWEW